MTLRGTIITLSPAELAEYHGDFYQSFHLEEDCLDLLDRENVRVPVVVIDPTTGKALCGITPGERRL